MKSPVSPKVTLEKTTLDEGLVVFRCPESGGCWIPAEWYWRWQGSGVENPVDQEASPETHEVSGWDDRVKLCPESGTIMTRFRVGQGVKFRIDRSVTGGVWLDAGEWEFLKRGDLHRSLHLIFTEPWQKSIVAADQEAAFRKRILERLGDEMLGRLDAIRSELTSESDWALALAYLSSKK